MTHQVCGKAMLACCLMRNCLFPTENVLKKTLIVHNNVTTFLATACMHAWLSSYVYIVYVPTLAFSRPVLRLYYGLVGMYV